MKFFTKQRVIILSALTAVILVLVTIIVSSELSGVPLADSPASTTPDHETVRDARVGLANYVEWENNFGGTGDEYPVSSVTLDGKPYIFGNTTSADLDFDGGGVFAARLSGYGKTEKFATYGSAGSTLYSATVLENGFALAVNGETPSVIFADFDLNAVSSVTLTAPESCTYAIVDVGSYENNLYIFRQSSGSQPLHVVCDIISKTGAAVGQKIFKQTLDLTYRGFFPSATLVTAFAESGSTSSCTTFAEWTVKGNVSYNRTVTATPYKTLSVFPSPYGWLALNTANGETFASVISASYALIRNVIIDFAGVKSGELFYLSATVSFYASVYVEGEINGLFSLGGDITKATRVSLPSYASMYTYGTSTADVLALVSAETITLAVITSSGTRLTTMTDHSKSPVIMRSGDNWFLTFAAKEKAAIVGGNYGGYDVVIAKIKF